jgi:capsular polysaccharide biosynthesis protein
VPTTISVSLSKVTPVVALDHVVFAGGVHDVDGHFVDFAKHVQWNAGLQHRVGDNPPELVTPGHANLPEGVYGGVFFNHFGHFLTESLGRLWAVNNQNFKHLPIYIHSMWGDIDFKDDESYHAVTLKLLGIATDRVRILKKFETIEKLHIPELLQWNSVSEVDRGVFFDFLSNAQKQIESSSHCSTSSPKRIYVSRSRWDPLRGIVVGEPDFEVFLAKNGYTAIYPETENLYTQLQLYANADSIIFAEGSAQHGCILLPNLKAKVAIVKRRPSQPRETRNCKVFGFRNNVCHIQEVRKYSGFNMPDWSGVSYVDYERVAKGLIDFGFIESSFEEWQSVNQVAERLTLSKFCIARFRNRLHRVLMRVRRAGRGICRKRRLKT